MYDKLIAENVPVGQAQPETKEKEIRFELRRMDAIVSGLESVISDLASTFLPVLSPDKPRDIGETMKCETDLGKAISALSIRVDIATINLRDLIDRCEL